MPKQSLEDMVASKMGRMALSLFKNDEEFKAAKDAEDICNLLKKRSNGDVQTTPQTVLRMINNWIASNKCKASDFAEILKASKKGTGRKGKISFREELETYYKKDIWKVFGEKLSGCKDIAQALSVLSHDSNGKIKTSEQTFRKTVEAGIEANEIPKDASWISIVPKKRRRRTAEEKAKESSSVESDNLVNAKVHCKKCGFTGQKVVAIYNKHCGTALKAQRCAKCQSWASGILTFEAYGKVVSKTCTTDPDGCVGEDFIDENWNIIPNPFMESPSKEQLDKMKKRKVM